MREERQTAGREGRRNTAAGGLERRPSRRLKLPRHLRHTAAFTGPAPCRFSSSARLNALRLPGGRLPPSFGFLLFWFFLSFNSCAAEQVRSDFYRGLLAGTERAAGGTARQEAAGFFEKALNSPNVYIRQAASEELLGLFYRGDELAGPVLKRALEEAAGSWAAAFEALNAGKEKVLSFTLSSGAYGGVSASSGGSFPDEAAFYVLQECRSRNAGFFNASENAAIEGHIAASRSRFSEALALFRSIPDGDRGIFLQYPDLLNDLGRSYQYAARGTEGLTLFLDWEKNAEAQNTDVRFRLLFFAARLARQRGLSEQGIALFTRALPLAPDPEQADACIWYILDSTLNRSPAAAILQLSAFAGQWHDDTYFSDVLDRLSRELVLRRQWKELIQVFGLIHGHTAEAEAKFAYIIGRAIGEGYLMPEEISLAAETPALMGRARSGSGTAASAPAEDAAPDREALSRAYMRIAREIGGVSSYYRMQSAAALGEPFLQAPETPPSAGKSGKAAVKDTAGAAMKFLLGFFSNGAAAFAPRYIRALEKELSAGELRVLAEAVEGAGLYAESIRLVSLYINKKDYEPSRRDLELYYPRPFTETVEQYAEKTGLAPELLFGLVRTESAFQSGIVSAAGAVGLTQLMPATAKEMAERIRRLGGPDYTGPDDAGRAGPNLLDPAINIHIGAFYLAYLMERAGTAEPRSAEAPFPGENTLLALLSYNGGMNRVRRWRTADRQTGGLPADLFLETVEFPETREYGRKVLAAAAMYGELYKK
ncbi:MAG: lytic transglycosylase domain-containing protein [Treponema sp.]|jgi:soluble lytic murein transglycosylase|nr:lytic transglycosylase domain-containing protein [Treponema sp.]